MVWFLHTFLFYVEFFCRCSTNQALLTLQYIIVRECTCITSLCWPRRPLLPRCEWIHLFSLVERATPIQVLVSRLHRYSVPGVRKSALARIRTPQTEKIKKRPNTAHGTSYKKWVANASYVKICFPQNMCTSTPH